MIQYLTTGISPVIEKINLARITPGSILCYQPNTQFLKRIPKTPGMEVHVSHKKANDHLKKVLEEKRNNIVELLKDVQVSIKICDNRLYNNAHDVS